MKRTYPAGLSDKKPAPIWCKPRALHKTDLICLLSYPNRFNSKTSVKRISEPVKRTLTTNHEISA